MEKYSERKDRNELNITTIYDPSKLEENTARIESEISEGKKAFLKQCLATAAMAAGNLSNGATMGFSAIHLPQLAETLGSDSQSEELISWIASAATIGMPLGCIMAGFLMEWLGRKKSMILTALTFIISVILTGVTDEMSIILLGRFIAGVSTGIASPLSAIYLGECTDPKYRGIFLASMPLAATTGVLIVHILGTYLPWKLTIFITGAFPVFQFVMFLRLPETPVWFARKQKLGQAEHSFYFYRGRTQKNENEYKAMVFSVELSQQDQLTCREKMTIVLLPEIWKPALIISILFASSFFSGYLAITYYAIDIMERTFGINTDPYIVMIVIDTFRVLTSGINCIVVKLLDKKVMIVLGGIISSVFLFGLSAFLYIADAEARTSLYWIPLTLLIIYISSITIFVAPMPWILSGELFPSRAKGLCSGFCTALAFFFIFVITKTSPYMFNDIGMEGSYLCFGAVLLAGILFLYFTLPQTNNKTLEDIQKEFKQNNKYEVTRL